MAWPSSSRPICEAIWHRGRRNRRGLERLLLQRRERHDGRHPHCLGGFSWPRSPERESGVAVGVQLGLRVRERSSRSRLRRGSRALAGMRARRPAWRRWRLFEGLPLAPGALDLAIERHLAEAATDELVCDDQGDANREAAEPRAELPERPAVPCSQAEREKQREQDRPVVRLVGRSWDHDALRAEWRPCRWPLERRKNNATSASRRSPSQSSQHGCRCWTKSWSRSTRST